MNKFFAILNEHWADQAGSQPDDHVESDSDDDGVVVAAAAAAPADAAPIVPRGGLDLGPDVASCSPLPAAAGEAEVPSRPLLQPQCPSLSCPHQL